ncbi:hypothetical protein M0R45_007515 [Rubus argutus]|uniref:FRIGIDA-like protein n=1 Tax=Rubus argutus TaxID=59490 RepID=A0AAW1XXX3_RUBAR
MVALESIEVYQAISDGTVNLVDKFFEMQRNDALKALDIYTERMLDVIEVSVISERQQSNAVNLVFAFKITEQFSPVPLLKSYLKEARKACLPVKPGNASPLVLSHCTNLRLVTLAEIEEGC